MSRISLLSGVRTASDVVGPAAAVGCLGFLIAAVIAWATHVVWVIQTFAGPEGVTFGQFVLALLGTILPPIGVVHGLIIWFS